MTLRNQPGTPLTPAHDLLDGRYVLGEELGRGGAAVVYRAKDTATGVTVAVKLMRGEFAEAVSAERFLREVRYAAALRHPNIVPVLNSGTSRDGIPYYVMPVYDGGTLAQRIARDGALPFSFIAHVIGDVAAALDHVHAHGVLHRDIKPQNIILDGDRALVADLGIARLLNSIDDRPITESGIVLGTPRYMSPEQAGHDDTIGPRSDVYSLGCVAYEMLTGEPPFNGPTAKSIIAKHRYEPIPRLHPLRPTLGADVQQVIETALAKTPADRYTGAGEFARALSAALSTGAVRRSRRVYAAASLVVFALIAFGAVLFARRIMPRAASRTSAVLEPHRVAVLYFENLSPSTNADYLGDALTESLIDQLSRVDALNVISPAGVRPFRGRTLPVDSIARLLGVGTIIGGSVQRRGDSLRVAVRLLDAASGQQLYSQSIDAPATGALRLQDSVMSDLAVALRRRLGDVIAVRANQASTRSPAAWEAEQIASRRFHDVILRQRESTSNAQLDAEFLRSDALYARAESLDVHWPLPTLKRAAVSALIAARGDSVYPPESTSRADSTAQQRWAARALRLASTAWAKGADTSDVLALRGRVELVLAKAALPGADTMRATAERDLRAAAERKSSTPAAEAALADLYLIEGRGDDALAAAQRAFDADAFVEVGATVELGFETALNVAQLDRARSWCDLGRRREPDNAEFLFCRLRLLALDAHRRADVDSAWMEVHHIESRPGGMPEGMWSFTHGMVAAAAARAGLRDSALHILALARTRRAADGTPELGRIVEAYVDLLVGDRANALRLIEEQTQRTPVAKPAIAQNPWFAALRGDPRFVAAVGTR